MGLRLLVAILISLSLNTGYGQQKGKIYQYSLDLSNTVDDRIAVTLIPPKVRDKEVIFYMPKIVPGTYAIADYGRYVKNFVAYDKKGKSLAVEKLDENSWKIKATRKISKITYWVDDTFDSQTEGPEIFWPAGTNIEEGKNFLINTSGFFGYLKGKTEIPFELNIIHPSDLYGSTGLLPVKSSAPVKDKKGTIAAGKSLDLFRPEDYDKLIDSPIMYSKPDTAIIRVANTDVLIGSYSPNKVITAKEIAESIREVLEAQTKFLGGNLPVNKYAFVFYFTDEPVTNYGALEHSYSSLYYMPEAKIDQMNQQLRDFAAHEFFHILTPLTVHSEEIENFDFNNPKMSKHLWLYEGVTEYFAGIVQVRYGLITAEQYINFLFEKMTTADQFIDDVPFTEISKYTLDKYHDQYYNVYQKGALIGLCLDLKLKKLSNGKSGLRELMLELSKKYGKQKAFKDDELFDVITQMTFPEIKEFFNRYVQGNESLPLKEVFNYVGINYEAEERFMDYSLGITYNELDVANIDSKPKLQIINTENLNEMGKALGFKEGDVLLAINDEPLPELGPELGTFITKHYRALPKSDTLTYTVSRKNDGEAWQEIKLSAPVKKVENIRRHVMIPNPLATQEQLKLREAWIKAGS